MATMADARRSSTQNINGNIQCGASSVKPSTTTQQTEIFYLVKLGDVTRTAKTIAEVNAILARRPNARVVKTTRVITTTTTHKRIR